MQRKQAFTLIELLVVISIIALLIGILLPALGAARRTARQMQNSTHVRGIHSGLVLYGQGNADYYPGLTNGGLKSTASITAAPNTYGYGTADGTLVAYRMAVLLRGNYFSPDYMRSPAENHSGIIPPILGADFADGAVYSYAMLNITDTTKFRVSEWKSTNTSRAVVVSDRNIGNTDTGNTAQSIHTATGDGWRGSVCFNDNHATFEVTDILKTEYALKGEVSADKLFSPSEATGATPAVSDADAAMVFKTGNAYTNQQP